MNYELLVDDVRTASKEELKKLFFKVCEASNERFKKINEDYEKRLNAALADREKETLILLKDQQFFANLLINALKEYDK